MTNQVDHQKLKKQHGDGVAYLADIVTKLGNQKFDSLPMAVAISFPTDECDDSYVMPAAAKVPYRRPSAQGPRVGPGTPG